MPRGTKWGVPKGRQPETDEASHEANFPSHSPHPTISSMYSSLCKAFGKSQVTIFLKVNNCLKACEEQKCFSKFLKGDEGFKVTVPKPLSEARVLTRETKPPPPCGK